MIETPVWECRCGHRNHIMDLECGNCHETTRDEESSVWADGYAAGRAAGARAVILDKNGNPIP